MHNNCLPTNKCLVSRGSTTLSSADRETGGGISNNIQRNKSGISIRAGPVTPVAANRPVSAVTTNDFRSISRNNNSQQRKLTSDRSSSCSRSVNSSTSLHSVSFNNLFPVTDSPGYPNCNKRFSSTSFHSATALKASGISAAASHNSLSNGMNVLLANGKYSSSKSSVGSISTLVSSTETLKDSAADCIISETKDQCIPKQPKCQNCGLTGHSILNCNRLSRVDKLITSSSPSNSVRSLNITPTNIPQAVKSPRTKLPRCNNCGLKGHRTQQCNKTPSMKDLSYFSPGLSYKSIVSSPDATKQHASEGSETDSLSSRISPLARRQRDSSEHGYRTCFSDTSRPVSRNSVNSFNSDRARPKQRPAGILSCKSLENSPAHFDHSREFSGKVQERKSALVLSGLNGNGSYYSLPRIKETPTKRVTIIPGSTDLLTLRKPEQTQLAKAEDLYPASSSDKDENDSGIGCNGSMEFDLSLTGGTTDKVELPTEQTDKVLSTNAVSTETQTEPQTAVDKKVKRKSSLKKTIRTIGSWLSIDRI